MKAAGHRSPVTNAGAAFSASPNKLYREGHRLAQTIRLTIHTNVIGPIKPKGYNGDSWAVMFTDDYSRYRWVYTFKQENKACPKTINFIKYVKTQYSRDIKVIKMDNGNEYGCKGCCRQSAKTAILTP